MAHRTIALILLALSFSQTAFASDAEEKRAPTNSKDVADTGSAASFDHRLPPVIPGETIEHNGKKMKVWSTSGEVPVGQVPPAPPAPGQQQQFPVNGLGGVIVDNRPDRGRN